MHARDGVKSVSIRGGALDGLLSEMLSNAVHIWTADAIVEIPAGVVSLAGEPEDD